jgi:hypothetical protein
VRIALEESFKKWIEFHFNAARAARLIPRATRLVFDDYDKSEQYPKVKVELRHLDVLDKIWRTSGVIVIQIWVDNEDARAMRQLTNWTYVIARNYGEYIPIFELLMVMWDDNDSEDLKDLELGEKLSITDGVSQLIYPQPYQAYQINVPIPPIVEDSVVVYLHDAATHEQDHEYQQGVDYTIDFATGKIVWLSTVDQATLATNNKEIRCYYTFRVFTSFARLMEHTMLETPFTMPIEQFPGVLRTDFSFEVIY